MAFDEASKKKATRARRLRAAAMRFVESSIVSRYRREPIGDEVEELCRCFLGKIQGTRPDEAMFKFDDAVALLDQIAQWHLSGQRRSASTPRAALNSTRARGTISNTTSASTNTHGALIVDS
jgi:hypothetical protein